jgi:hypothetical protein
VQDFLLVDDRDGRVLAQFANALEALRALDELEQEAPDWAASLCLLRLDDHQGAVIGTEATVRLRSLT